MIGDIANTRYIEAFDGCHTYASLPLTDVSPVWRTFKDFRYTLNGIDWDQALALVQQGQVLPLKERYLALPVQPGEDTTKIPGNYQYPYIDRRDGQTYAEYWRSAMSFNPDGVTITSWNEWHEGTEIEPSVNYGFTYINLTRHFISIFKGTIQPLNAAGLKVQTDLGNTIRSGARYSSLSVIDDSPSVPAIYVNLSISTSAGLDLTGVLDLKGIHCYKEAVHSHSYNVVIPLLKPGETIPYDVTFSASIGSRNMNLLVTGYSPSGVATTVSAANQLQVVFDRVVVNLVATASRVEVGSDASIVQSAYYEYDHQPFSGTICLNDTLTKNSVGKRSYTVSGISDPLYGLTNFISNNVTITFDRMTANSAMETIGPGSVSLTTKLAFESDGQPVGNATVLVNGVPTAETTPGTFQITVATWSPVYQFNITIERPGFSTQNNALSGYAAGNMAVEIGIIAILLVVLILLIRRRRG
jgi:hypothetical protein